MAKDGIPLRETEMPRVDFIGQRSTQQNCSVNTSWIRGQKTQNSSGWALPQENQPLFRKGCSSRRFLRGSLRANHHSSSAAAGAARGLSRHRSGHTPAANTALLTQIYIKLVMPQVLCILQGGEREISLTQTHRTLYRTFFK